MDTIGVDQDGKELWRIIAEGEDFTSYSYNPVEVTPSDQGEADEEGTPVNARSMHRIESFTIRPITPLNKGLESVPVEMLLFQAPRYALQSIAVAAWRSMNPSFNPNLVIRAGGTGGAGGDLKWVRLKAICLETIKCKINK